MRNPRQQTTYKVRTKRGADAGVTRQLSYNMVEQRLLGIPFPYSVTR